MERMLYLYHGVYIFGAYLIGSISIGFLCARTMGIANLHLYGSGSTGATNTARALGVPFFYVVFFGDMFKAFLYIKLCSDGNSASLLTIAIAYALLFGNSYSIFLGGRAGKGVATLYGILGALEPSLFALALITWIINFIVLHVEGIASVCTVLLLPFYLLLFKDSHTCIVSIPMALWIIGRHTQNIIHFLTNKK